MTTDAEKLASIRMMLDHFDKVQDRYEFPNILDDAVLLREWTLDILAGEPYDWKQFTVEFLTHHYWEHSVSEKELADYKREINYER